MQPVLLALASAALFGAMTVALRLALLRSPDAVVGAAATAVVALALTTAFVPFAGGDASLPDLALFAVAGALAPGVSQLLFSLAVRDAGAARTSVVVGAAPLFTVVLGLALLGEPFEAPLLLGALLIVAGGTALGAERLRPSDFRAIGLAYALFATVLFASRDTFVRWFSDETSAASVEGAAATLLGGSAVLVATVPLRPGTAVSLARVRPFVPAGILFGLSYVCLFAAYYRGPVTVVSPLVATESLWGVALSALLIGRSELVGRRLVVGAALIVAGGVLIGVSR
jgi:drug/metabolite transporter (DMT)-like permease